MPVKIALVPPTLQCYQFALQNEMSIKMTPAPAFRMITAVLIGLGTAACASKASAPVNPTLQQTHSVECIASNVERSGCRTTHEFVVEFSAQPSPRPEEPAENTY